MIRTPHSSLVQTMGFRKNSIQHATKAGAIAAIALLGIGATPVAAGSPASIPDANESARNSLQEFAKTWMGKMERNEAQNRQQPSVRPGASENVITYRGFGDDYQVELRPTGHPAAPFVGILRYTEQVYTCRAAGTRCSVASSVPVTEIFRYQSGRWVY